MDEITRTAKSYIQSLPEQRQRVMGILRQVILENLPEGFEEEVSDMIHYVVPLAQYPKGSPEGTSTPLKLLSIASQKNFVGIYHKGFLEEPKIKNWFMNEYHKYARRNLNMSHGCVRFTAMDDIPYPLIGRLAAKMTMIKWIRLYEKKIKK